ncbi:MAG: hypothetical protein IIW59_03745 [Alistipes sp.]|nr:hypothetical protein [Alistipes sp.]
MKNQPKYLTTFVFKSKDPQMKISEAMLALFPFAEWNETPDEPAFESPSLCRLLASVYLENSDAVKSDHEHEFEVLSHNSVQLTLLSYARPTLRKRSIRSLTPNDTFILYRFERKSLNE